MERICWQKIGQAIPVKHNKDAANWQGGLWLGHIRTLDLRWNFWMPPFYALHALSITYIWLYCEWHFFLGSCFKSIVWCSVIILLLIPLFISQLFHFWLNFVSRLRICGWYVMKLEGKNNSSHSIFPKHPNMPSCSLHFNIIKEWRQRIFAIESNACAMTLRRHLKGILFYFI